jgi:acetoin utilization deacetylase AcuC-like enzyme
VAIHLAGGTHHAFHNYGEGYCLFNDSVVASRVVQSEGKVERIIIIDCDVHKGNGTASILADDPSIFTFSIHGKKNFPFDNEKSDLDIPLDDNTDDAAYLKALEHGLSHAFTVTKPGLALYLAGADPYTTDRFGRLALTKKGLKERDQLVFDHCLGEGIPIAITMAGGYAENVNDTVDIHFQTVKTALNYQHEWVQLTG